MTDTSTSENAERLIANSWPRQCARLSMVAPFAALLLQLLTAQLLAKGEDPTASPLYLLSSSLATLLIAGGFIASLFGFWGGRRQRSTDTQIIACLGMLISGGLLVVIAWAFVLVWTQPAG